MIHLTRRYLFLAFTFVGVAVLTGCASTQPINEFYSVELSQIAPGDSLEKVKGLLPKAVVSGQNVVGGQRVDAYQLKHTYMYDSWHGFTEKQELWFYFYDTKLVKWGKPNDWPAPADLIIERRNR